jgi:preprotein translocase subunit SecD
MLFSHKIFTFALRSILLAVTMIIGRTRFNIYLLALLIACGFGCQSPEKKREKQVTALALHLEVLPDVSDFSRTITVFREKPLTVHIDKSAFLTETQVAGAEIVEDGDGWGLQIKFGKRGTWLLEQYTTSNPGKHIAIFSTFGGEKKEARWLAAPLITRRISNGILKFTPDASREEAEEIVFGLNNVAREVEKESKW